ncbi:MAG TPA: hypothetical protein VFS77_03865 [Pyrinomonadaceae bacterium]|nr:hypothetical protein [Pyrinomonadaceae bacterium]
MNAKFSFLSLLLIVLFSTQIALANESAALLARKAVSENPAESTAAIEELRAMGPAGLETLLTQHADEINRHIANPSTAATAEWQRITKALDHVGQQKNNYISGLYWYTDLEDAKRVAREANKPILSLRLLGKLTDELSCANSRFFRTVLYANAQIAPTMRDQFVLHWQSVRPVPVITIDFGDGRKLERTVTGNSIHYILDSDAQLIDALPGLYGPEAFQRGLTHGAVLFESLAGKTGADRRRVLIDYYRNRANNISLAWGGDTMKIGQSVPRKPMFYKDKNIDAISIGPIAITKMVLETTALRSMTSASEALGRVNDEDAWRKIAKLHDKDAKLDERSLALIKSQNPSLSNEELTAMVQKFEELVALDTVRNEYMLHPKLLLLMTDDSLRQNLDSFNDHVYATLFLTPKTDPWLGLVSPDVYTAIDKAGISKSQ